MNNNSPHDRKSYYRSYSQEYRKRTKRVKCTLTNREFQEIFSHARKAGAKPSTFLRNAGLAYIRQEYIVPKNQEEDLRKVILSLRNIGNNLNQIAAMSNKFKNATVFDLAKTKHNLIRLETAIKDFVRNPSKQKQSDDSQIDEQKNNKLQSTT